MKTFILYVILGAIAVNVAGNVAANSADGLQSIRSARAEKLCKVNRAYCL